MWTTDRAAPTLGMLVGAMLGAADDVVYARGSGCEAGTPVVEEYWKWKRAARMSTDGRTVTTGPAATRTRVAGRPSEVGPGHLPWLGWTDRLLRPQHLYIWGRPGEDWRLGELAGWSDVVEETVVLTLEHVEDGRVGAAHVAPDRGRIMFLDLPGFLSWRLDLVDDAPDVGSWPLRRWFEGCLPPGSEW